MNETPTIGDSLREIILRIFPWLVLTGLHTYRVASVNNDGTLNLARPTELLSPPTLPRVPQWAGAGVEAKPKVDSEVLVIFRDYREKGSARPAIVAFMPLETRKPDEIAMNADDHIEIGKDANTIHAGSGAAIVIRSGDTISIAGAGVAGVITVTSGTAEIPPAISRLKA